MSDPSSNSLTELHDQVSRAHAEIKHVAKFLKSLPISEQLHKASTRADHAIERLDKAILTLSMNPASLLGSIGGQKTAERGPDYFRKIAAMRKTRAGGRPKKTAED
jgi:hypothetical protein